MCALLKQDPWISQLTGPGFSDFASTYTFSLFAIPQSPESKLRGHRTKQFTPNSKKENRILYDRCNAFSMVAACNEANVAQYH